MLTLVAAVLGFVFLDGAARWAVIATGAALDVAESLGLLWWSRRRRPAVGVETLVGAPAVVVTACRPVGQVRVAGELWSAHCEPGADPGDRVTIERVDGLTLTVTQAPAR
jgi:membrane protein implicated in regulation of membrane protease activity